MLLVRAKKYGTGWMGGWVVGKLMRFDQPQAKFCLKSDLNCLLIDFFDPIPAARFTCRNNSIQIRTIIRSKSLILDRFNQK